MLNVNFRPRKYVRILRDDFYNPEEHYLSTTPQRAEKACGYDLDDTDIAWLEVLNGERALVSVMLLLSPLRVNFRFECKFNILILVWAVKYHRDSARTRTRGIRALLLG